MTFSVDKERYAFSGMIGGFGGRIAAVVSRYDQKIVLIKKIQYLAETVVELVHGGRIAFDIVPVAVLHVEVDEINVADTMEIPVHELYELGDALGISRCGIGLGDAARSKEIIDLSYGDDIEAFAL